MSTSDRLAEVLAAEGLHEMAAKARTGYYDDFKSELHEMAAKARTGYYDDFKSELATPIVQLVRDLQATGKAELANRVMNGEFDSTKEEAEEWFAREGKDLLS